MQKKKSMPKSVQAKWFSKVSIIELPIFARLDIISSIVLAEDCCKNIGEVLCWCTYGFNETFISTTKDLFAKLEKIEEDRDLRLWKPYSSLCEWFVENCKLNNGKISRESKYMMLSDYNLLPKAQIEAQRLIASGNSIKAIEITKPIYEKYIDIRRCLSVVKPYGTIVKLYKNQGVADDDSIYEEIYILQSESCRKYLHDNHIFPIDTYDLSYITDFCKFYEEEIVPYQMLYSDTESKGSPNEHGQLDRLETEREKKYYQRAIEAGYAEEIDSGFLWLKPVGQLGYFISIVYKPSLYNQKPTSRLNALWWYKVNGTNSIEKVKSLSANISKAPQKHRDNRDDVQQWIDKMEKEVFFDEK